MTTEAAGPRRSAVSRPLWQAALESAVLVGVMVGLNLGFFRDDPGLVKWTPHPMLAVTLLILARYGFLPGLFAATLSVLAYAGLLVSLADPPTLHHLLAAPYSTPVAVLVPTTVLLGMLVQRHLDRLRMIDHERALLATENEALKAEQAKLRDVNVELAGKVVGAGATLQTLYRYAKDLNVNDVALIYSGVTRMLEDVVKAEVVTVWTPREGGQLKLAARQGAGEPNPTFSLTRPLRERLSQGVFALHDLPDDARTPGLPYLMGRVTGGKGGEVAAYLSIEKLPFARYNAETIRLFSMVVEWASESVGNALAFQKLSPAERAAHLKKQKEETGAVAAYRPGAQAAPPAASRGETGLSRLLAQATQSLGPAGKPARPPAVAGKAAQPPSVAPSQPGRENTGAGLRGLLASADQLLARRHGGPAPTRPGAAAAPAAAEPEVADAEVVQVIEHTRMVNHPLGLLLNEIGSYLSEEKDK